MTARVRSKPNPRPKATGPGEVAEGVFVGAWSDATGFVGRRFCVLDELPADAPADAGFTIYDDSQGAANLANLDRLADRISAARREGQPVLVFCGHGVRRGPLGAAWYVHRSERIPLDAAFERVRAVRPQTEEPREWMDHPESLYAPAAGGRAKGRA